MQRDKVVDSSPISTGKKAKPDEPQMGKKQSKITTFYPPGVRGDHAISSDVDKSSGGVKSKDKKKHPESQKDDKKADNVDHMNTETGVRRDHAISSDEDKSSGGVNRKGKKKHPKSQKDDKKADNVDHMDTDEAAGNSHVPVPGENISDADTGSPPESPPAPTITPGSPPESPVPAITPGSDEGDSQNTQNYSLEGDTTTSTTTATTTSSSKKRNRAIDDLSDSESQEAQMWLQEFEVEGPSEKRLRPRLISKWSDVDTEDYRLGYPRKKDKPELQDNLLFYTNQISSTPNGAFIDKIHEKWFGDYELLERHHGYIQWLFPIREKGMNFQSQELQKHEIEFLNKDPDARDRILKSYVMMLDFYGIRLVSAHKGTIERNKNWIERFKHLNRSYHNYLRITRILKSLGEFDYEYMKKPFLEFILHEAFEERTLVNCQKSCVDYWIQTLRNDKERKLVATRAQQLKRHS